MRTVGSVINNTSTDDLTERISIIYQSTRRNERGDIVEIEDITRAEIWAKVLPIAARRYIDGAVELTNEISYRVTIRYRIDIAPDDIILWRGKRLRQTSPPYDAESCRIWTVLECEEMISDGRTKESL